MAIYVAPEELRKGIFRVLDLSEFTIVEQTINFEDARQIVRDACYDPSLLQPAVKLAGLYLEFVYSAWFGEVLHFHGPFTGADTPEPSSSSFLFHKDKRDPWVFVEFAREVKN